MTAVRAALPYVAMEAPQGCVRIDRDNRHCHLTPRIGVSTEAGGFEVIVEAPGPVRPDPYLVWHECRTEAGAGPRRAPSLRLVR
jgi:branched-chain amino acid transport system substrate-binding protein